MAVGWQDFLTHTSGPLSFDTDVVCLLLAHNEELILEDFFAHYRAMGTLHFLVVDDRSNDGTVALLAKQQDVTVFTPKQESEYRLHKREWRALLLDAFAVDRWCLTPDADERLVWYDREHRSLADVIASLEADNAEALVADMVDMYADVPLAEHIATEGSLIEQFPFFDDPIADPNNYRVMMVPSVRFRRRFRTPQTESYGGMRDRIFGRGIKAHGLFGRLLLKGSLSRPRTIPRSKLVWRIIEAKLSKSLGGTYPLVITKLALVKWRKGYFFSGGPHHISADLVVGRERAAYLHFPITRGTRGLSYINSRGQHARGSRYYSVVLNEQEKLATSPVYFGSKRFQSSKDLGPLISGPNGASNT